MATLDKLLGKSSEEEKRPPQPVDAFQKPDPDRDALDESAELFKTVFKGEIIP